MGAPNIRFADIDDCASVAGVHAAAYRGAFAERFGAIKLEEAVQAICTTQRWRTLFCELSDTHMELAGAEHHGQVIGFVHYGKSSSDSDQGEIQRLFVRPDNWGSGVSRQLMDLAIEQLRSSGYVEVVVRSADTPQAIRFYEKCGMSRTGATTFDELVPGLTISNIEFAIDL